MGPPRRSPLRGGVSGAPARTSDRGAGSGGGAIRTRDLRLMRTTRTTELLYPAPRAPCPTRTGPASPPRYRVGGRHGLWVPELLHMDVSMSHPHIGGPGAARRCEPNTALPGPPRGPPRKRGATGAGIEPTCVPGPLTTAVLGERASPELPACPPGVHLPALPCAGGLTLRPPRGVAPGSHSTNEPAPLPWGSTGVTPGRVKLAGFPSRREASACRFSRIATPGADRSGYCCSLALPYEKNTTRLSRRVSSR